MTKNQNIRILTINSGSSSLKFALYDMGQHEKVILSGAIEGINFRTGRFHIKACLQILVDGFEKFLALLS